MKKILITGANSYIGDKTQEYLLQYPDKYIVHIKDTIGWEPQVSDFQGYDAVFNVAGIAHIRENSNNRPMYYKINRDLAIKIATVAKTAGVRQYILLSSMSVYGMTVGTIDKKTKVNPQNAYGKSKAEADEVIFKLSDDDFRFACLRPPMVYGKGCKGNYQMLRKAALHSPLFPSLINQRSMVYVGNLCEFVRDCIDKDRSGLFFPQNSYYTCTSEMVKHIADVNGRKIRMTKLFNKILEKCNLKLINKVFGNLIYEPTDMVDVYSFEESIILTEK